MAYTTWSIDGVGFGGKRGALFGRARPAAMRAANAIIGAIAGAAMVAAVGSAWTLFPPLLAGPHVFGETHARKALILGIPHNMFADLGDFSPSPMPPVALASLESPLDSGEDDPEGGDALSGDAQPAAQVLASVPLPKANPLLAARAAIREDGARGTVPVVGEPPPLPQARPKIAELTPADRPLGDAPPAAPGESVAVPGPGDRYALYDIRGHMVYLPNGERLEAHSGYGDYFDDPKSVHLKMRGVTPPNTYVLSMREQLFHGVEALRMKPVGSSKMYGRDGILAHTYMLGPRGDSNGCVSFKDYQKFLAAYRRGEVTHMVVVTQLDNAPASPNLLSWLLPR